jgi:hypothetical protein
MIPRYNAKYETQTKRDGSMKLSRFRRRAAARALVGLAFFTSATVVFLPRLPAETVRESRAERIPYFPPMTIDSGDYNGNGVDDICTFRREDGLWALRDRTRVYFGSTVDEPVSR